MASDFPTIPHCCDLPNLGAFAMHVLALALLALLGGERAINGIRLSPWPPPGVNVTDTAVRFRRLASVTSDVAIVLPDKSDGGRKHEVREARENIRTIVAMLEELGLSADTFDQKAVAGGAIGGRRVAILPYNPSLGDDCAASLTRFARSGGKLLVCYWLDSRLGAALGFGRTKYVRQKRDGQFAEMRFDAANVADLPASVRQKSWNIMVAEPTGHNARVIGRWYDAEGNAAGDPAALLSDRGAFLSHVLLPDDRDGKKRLLAALLGHLDPPLWKHMAEVAIERAGRVGHCATADEAATYLKTKEVGDKEDFRRAQQSLERAKEQLAQKAYAQSVETAASAHQLLVRAYLRAAASTSVEGRAMWNHSGTGAYPGDWERSAGLLAQNGFNMVLPNMLWGGVAHYPSDVLPRSATFERYGDQIEQCCAAAKKHGLEVHVWKVNFNLATAPQNFVEKLRRQGRTQVSVTGEPCDWLCPSNPENRKLELESMLEVARKYPIDGLHFDYIRYPDQSHCYCDGCRRRFEAESGRKVLDRDWPKICYSGARKEEYNDWRCRQITSLVAAVSREARKIRPGLKISAAVFGSYPACRASVAQDWPAWIEAGDLDFICPMDYSASDAAFGSLVRSQIKLTAGRVPVYAGIGATATPSTLAPDRVVGQILLARSLGAAGFTIFNFEPSTAAAIVPAVGLGTGSRKAAPPHHTTP